MRRRFRSILVAAALSCSLLNAGEWPQFRGPNCSGLAATSAPLPTEFSGEKNVTWSHQLGDGIACPIVARGRLYTTAMSAENRFALYSFDAETGEEKWKNELSTGPLPEITPPNSHASSTPASDGERVYVYFSTLGLLAFHRDGQLLWHRALPQPHYLLDWGAAASPIVYKDLVYFNQDDDLSPFLIAIDKHTGEVRWRTERPEMLGGYAVPVVCEVGGRAELVIAGTGKLKGYSATTGEELWTCNTLLRTIMTTPVVHDGIAYLSVQSYGDSERILKYALLQWKDTDQDGKLSRDELPPEFEKKFTAGDANGDGVLEDAEIDTAFQSVTNLVGGGNTVQAVRCGGSGDVTESHVLWNIDNKAPSNISSPLLVSGRLFMVKKGGISSCFQASSGKEVWYQKRIPNFGNYYASPVAGDGKIYITGENGVVVVLEDSPELKVLSENDVGDSCVATPAISNGRLYLRTRSKIMCVAEEVKS